MVTGLHTSILGEVEVVGSEVNFGNNFIMKNKTRYTGRSLLRFTVTFLFIPLVYVCSFSFSFISFTFYSKKSLQKYFID